MTDRERLLDDLRPVAFAIAYRMLGSVSEAEDVVQEAPLRVHEALEAGERIARFQTTREHRDELAERFFQAAEQGNIAWLEALLAHDVQLTGDGGGKSPTLALRGRSRVAHAVMNWVQLSGRGGVSVHRAEVNGGHGALYLDAQERVIGVLVLDIAGGRIVGIIAIVNRDKLAHLGPVGDLAWMMRSANEELGFARAGGDPPGRERPSAGTDKTGTDKTGTDKKGHPDERETDDFGAGPRLDRPAGGMGVAGGREPLPRLGTLVGE